VQTKQNAPKGKVTKRTHFYRKRKPISCLFTFVNKNKNLYLPTKQQSANTNVLIRRYPLSAKRPIIGRYQLSADNHCISNEDIAAYCSGLELLKFLVGTLTDVEVKIVQFECEVHFLTMTNVCMFLFTKCSFCWLDSAFISQ